MESNRTFDVSAFVRNQRFHINANHTKKSRNLRRVNFSTINKRANQRIKNTDKKVRVSKI